MTRENKQKKPGKKPRFIDPPNVLRHKIGYGGVDPLRLKRAEEYIDENPEDFTVIAQDLMKRLDEHIARARAGEIDGRPAIEKLTQPIMELKANGGMFQYMLVSEIADIVLNFLENIEELNKEVYDIIDAHQNTLNVIITNKLKGAGGKEGKALAQELYEACLRYYKKYDVKPRG